MVAEAVGEPHAELQERPLEHSELASSEMRRCWAVEAYSPAWTGSGPEPGSSQYDCLSPDSLFRAHQDSYPLRR